MCILFAGSYAGLKIIDEQHGGEAIGFYIGDDVHLGGVRLRISDNTIQVTSFIDTAMNQLKVTRINFGV